MLIQKFLSQMMRNSGCLMSARLKLHWSSEHSLQLYELWFGVAELGVVQDE